MLTNGPFHKIEISRGAGQKGAAQDNTGGPRRRRLAEEAQEDGGRRKEGRGSEQKDKIRVPLTEIRELYNTLKWKYSNLICFSYQNYAVPKT